MTQDPSSLDHEPLRVAIADHYSDGAADLLRQVLDARPRVEIVFGDVLNDEPTMLDVMPDVVVLTWGGAGDLGTMIATARRAAPESAIVVVIPWYDEATFLAAVRAGAEDCLTASQIDGPGLMRTLLLATERHRVVASLQEAALSDELTGLLNRRGYVRRATAMLRSADPRLVWQLYFDVDDLKQINDTYGHWAGDRALMEIAGVLRHSFRAGDLVARVGGDEFVVLAIAPADMSPESWTARWREPLAQLSTRHEFPISVSVGIAQPDDSRPTTPEDLLSRADTTMYMAKRLRKKLARGDGGERGRGDDDEEHTRLSALGSRPPRAESRETRAPLT